IPEEDRSGILHSAPLVIRNREHVKFFERVSNIEPLVIEMDRLLRGFQCELTLALLFRDRTYANRKAGHQPWILQRWTLRLGEEETTPYWMMAALRYCWKVQAHVEV